MVAGQQSSLVNIQVLIWVADVLELPEGTMLEVRKLEHELLEALEHCIYRVLVKEGDESILGQDSRILNFDEMRFPGAK